MRVENKLPREDRYTWRHNCVWLFLANCISQKLKQINGSRLQARADKFIQFVPSGFIPSQKRSNQQSQGQGCLGETRDWTCNFDLPEFNRGSMYLFPPEVEVTDVRCDGHIISRSKKICMILELSVPTEDNIDYWHSVKREKYEKEFSAVTGWKLLFTILEVGCRGWIPPRFFSAMHQLGFSNREARTLHDGAQLIARKCSYMIWLNRFNKDFPSMRITVDHTHPVFDNL